ncbi:MAG TPA: hypothetical protein V6C96_04105 [Vampirovibrionales bacterium]
MKAQYNKLLMKDWIVLTPHEEDILEKAVQQDSLGGASLKDIRYQEIEADKLKNDKYLKWNHENQRYQITALGRDLYEFGQKVKEKELQKDKRLRSKRLIK